MICAFNSNAQSDSTGNTPCSMVEKRVDKFDGKTTWNTPLAEAVSFLKVLRNKDTSLMLMLRCKGASLSVGKKGVVVLLKDGTKLQYPNTSVKASVSSDSEWTYSCMILINKEDKSKILNSKITDFRLYVYDYGLSETEQENTSERLLCVLKSK